MSAPWFLANLAATVLLLVVTLVTGKTGRRRAHFIAAPVTVVVLTLAIWQAELFGRDYDFDFTRKVIHLCFAGISLATLPGTIWSGLLLIRRPQIRRVHQRWVSAFVISTVLSIVTAIWMMMSGTPKV